MMRKPIRRRPLRRLLQFRLRTLLLVMTLSGIGVGFYHGYLLPYERHGTRRRLPFGNAGLMNSLEHLLRARSTEMNHELDRWQVATLRN